jgi:hypothetical protein
MEKMFCASWIKAAAISLGLAICVAHSCGAADRPSIVALAKLTEKRLAAHGDNVYGLALSVTAKQLEVHIKAIEEANRPAG